jgi:phosphoglycolate phosphatase-like HAD superfamily hydrolase
MPYDTGLSARDNFNNALAVLELTEQHIAYKDWELLQDFEFAKAMQSMPAARFRFEYAVKILETLQKAGFPIVAFSNSRDPVAKLRQADLAQYFTKVGGVPLVIGKKDVLRSKPDPAGFSIIATRLFRLLGLPKLGKAQILDFIHHNYIMIGDGEVDKQVAAAVGIPCMFINPKLKHHQMAPMRPTGNIYQNLAGEYPSLKEVYENIVKLVYQMRALHSGANKKGNFIHRLNY